MRIHWFGEISVNFCNFHRLILSGGTVRTEVGFGSDLIDHIAIKNKVNGYLLNKRNKVNADINFKRDHYLMATYLCSHFMIMSTHRHRASTLILLRTTFSIRLLSRTGKHSLLYRRHKV